MPDLNFRGKFRPLENIDIRWTERITGQLTGIATIGEHELVVELGMQKDDYQLEIFYMPPTDPEPDSNVPLPDFLKPYDGHTAQVEGVKVGRLYTKTVPRRGKLLPNGEYYWADYYNFQILGATVSNADGDAAIEAAGGFSRAEIAELGRLADAEDWDAWQAMMDFIDGGRV